jgi:hypothetical protein
MRTGPHKTILIALTTHRLRALERLIDDAEKTGVICRRDRVALHGTKRQIQIRLAKKYNGGVDDKKN